MYTGTCLIIGAGQAASQLAFSLRKEGWSGAINIIGAEELTLYQKPFLSKGYLLGDKEFEDIVIKKRSAYEKKEIEITSSVTVIDIDRESQQVKLSNNEVKSYQKLAICTGASARQLNIEGKEKNNIFYLNNFSDAQKIREITNNKTSKKAVIIGGGFIGLEVACCLRKKGIHVTIIESEDRILSRVSAPEISHYFTKLHEDNGVKFIKNKQVSSFVGNKSVEGVSCTDSEIYRADIVIVGIGAIPNTTLAEKAGLNVSNGIVVDKFSVTSDPNIVAAGDCSIYHNSTTGSKVRLESVQNAMAQAKNAASYICGNKKHFDEIPWFWSDQYQSKLQIAGLNKGFTHTICRGVNNKFSLWYFKNDYVIAVDCINNPKDFLFAKKAISKKLLMNQEQLHDINIPLSNLTNITSITVG